jgi:hypothetical protein
VQQLPSAGNLAQGCFVRQQAQRPGHHTVTAPLPLYVLLQKGNI